MKRLISLAGMLLASSMLTWAGPSILLSGPTNFTVKYNAFYEWESAQGPILVEVPELAATVNYTLTHWIPFQAATPFTQLIFDMEIQNNSSVYSYVTSLAWVADKELWGSDGFVFPYVPFYYFNDPGAHGYPIDPFPGGGETCISSVEDECGAKDPGSPLLWQGVHNTVPRTIQVTMRFDGYSAIEFEKFWVRYQGFELAHTLPNGQATVLRDLIGIGEVVPAGNGEAVVPEPSSVVALAVGVGVAAWFGRRRKV